MYDNIQTIRYMGNKNKLLDFIVPEIEKITKKNGTICDLMGGTNTISYALKRNYKIITNDVQKYSECIANAIIVNNKFEINSKYAESKLKEKYEENLNFKKYDFFVNVYKDTYFSEKQCLEIDSIRYAIDFVEEIEEFNLFLTALMGAMCKVQSTPGHFAQYMPKDHKRILPLREMSVWNEFLIKCDDYCKIVKNNFNNQAFNMDYKELLKIVDLKEVDTFYLDSPYSGEQYSRFYHILETVVKYDNPKVAFKAKYREDRFMSDFCYKKSVENEFETIIEFCKKNNSNLVISYSNKGVIECKKLEDICKKYYTNIEIKTYNYKHSTQGKGSNELLEYLYILKK